MEYKVFVYRNDGKCVLLSEDKVVVDRDCCYDYYAVQRGDFWQLLSDVEKRKIKSFSVSLMR